MKLLVDVVGNRWTPLFSTVMGLAFFSYGLVTLFTPSVHVSGGWLAAGRIAAVLCIAAQVASLFYKLRDFSKRPDQI